MKIARTSTFFAIRMLLTMAIVQSLIPPDAHAGDVFVSPNGNDAGTGTATQPFATLQRAQQASRGVDKPVTVLVGEGVYYLPETLVLGKEDSDVTWCAADNKTVVVSGGSRLDLTWTPWRDGIYQAETPPGLTIDQLFVNGARHMMARYPDYDPNVRPYGGYAADAFSKERAARWSNPVGGYIHAMHRAHWGGYHYRITGKDADGNITYEGGWQNNRQMGMHGQHRFVENIFEELDAPGEWFHDADANRLYYFPPQGVDPGTAVVEVVRLRHLIELTGARNVALRGLVFRHAARTFMDVKEPLLRSDWTIYRGGAVRFDGCEDCTVADCEFDQMGGNAVFVNNYNRRVRIMGCDIHDTGATAVAFVGDPAAVRNPLFEYGQRQDYGNIDRTPGPKSDNYPADCVVEDCLVRGVGLIEKQATGVEISMSQGITIRHCSIYDASRAGINVSEGTWGGHLIEFCDVFDTVRETGDHGSFNSWGRDRYWHLKGAPTEDLPELALLDAVKPTIIRNNRWRCDHGWDVDLDDGSSNYEITNNLFLHGGLKLREGFRRKVWNNIAVGNTFHPHVWYGNSGDEVTGNIWMGAYRPAGGMPKGNWGKEVDRNLFATSDADRTRFAAHGCDANSLVGDPLFVDPANGDYRVQEGSPALRLGFENFPMDRFGVRKPALRKIARTPDLPQPGQRSRDVGKADRIAVKHYWQGATVRELTGDEYSAFGISKDAGGIQLADVPENCLAVNAGLHVGDVILKVGEKAVRDVTGLLRATDAGHGEPLSIGFVRDQAAQQTVLRDYLFTASESSDNETFRTLGLVTDPNVATIKAITTRPQTRNAPPATLNDGGLTASYGPVFGNGEVNGIYKVDLGRPVEVREIRTYSFNQNNKRGPQHVVLFASASEQDPGWNIDDRTRLRPIAEIDVSTTARFLATSLQRTGRAPVGTYRWLLWRTIPVTPLRENTAFQEFQVLTVP